MNPKTKSRRVIRTACIMFFLCCFPVSITKAQTPKTDSLLAELKKHGTKNTRSVYTIYFELGTELQYTNPDTAIWFFLKAENVALVLQDKDLQARAILDRGWCHYLKSDNSKALGLFRKCLTVCQSYNGTDTTILKNIGILTAGAYSEIGTIYSDQGDFIKALDYYYKSLDIHKKTADKIGIAKALGNIGSVYLDQGNFPMAIDFLFKSLKTNEEIHDKPAQAANLTNIGIFYFLQKDYEKALSYLFKALTITQEIGNRQSESEIYGNIANIYSSKGDFDKGLDYYLKALKIYETLNDQAQVAMILGNIGNLHADRGDNESALKYYMRALKTNEALNYTNSIANNLANIGGLYVKTGALSKAYPYLEQAISIYKELNLNYELGLAYRSLYELHQKNHKPAEALEAYKQHIAYRDSVFNEENRSASIKKEMQFEFEKKQAADSLKVAEERVITKARFEQDKNPAFRFIWYPRYHCHFCFIYGKPVPGYQPPTENH